MQAVVFAGEGRVAVDEVPRPVRQEPGDAVVRVTRAAICGSDLHLLSGKTPGMRIGGVIGHEFTGVVVDGDEPAPGTRVVGSFLIACGSCPPCRARRFNHCARRRALGLGALMGDLDGAQADYVRVPSAALNLKALPAELSDEQALFCGDVLATGFYASALAGAGPDTTAVIAGGGPVGALCALACRTRGARALVAETEPARRAFLAGRLGLEVLDPGQDLGAAVAQATGGRLADCAIEAVGAPEVLKQSLKAVRAGGTVVVVGVYGAERLELPLGRVWVRALSLRFAGLANVHAHLDEALGAVAAGKLDPAAAITHHLPLAAAAEGYELFAAKEAFKVVLLPGS